MSERGVFAVDRGIWDHPMLNSREPFSRREAWLWILSEAGWKSRLVRVDGKRIELQRGQLAHSIRFLAEQWGWPKSNVSRFLEVLKSETMIGTESGTGITIITVCNYDEYQRVSLPDRDTEQDTKRDISGTPAGHDRDNTNTLNTRNTLKKNLSDDFEKFKQAYPKRDGANPWEPARKKFLAAIKSGVEPVEIIAGAQAYANAEAAKVGTPYIAQAKTWLNERRWKDYAPAPASVATGPPRPPLPGMRTHEEILADAERRKNEATPPEGAGVLALGVGVSGEEQHGLGHD